MQRRRTCDDLDEQLWAKRCDAPTCDACLNPMPPSPSAPLAAAGRSFRVAASFAWAVFLTCVLSLEAGPRRKHVTSQRLRFSSTRARARGASAWLLRVLLAPLLCDLASAVPRECNSGPSTCVDGPWMRKAQTTGQGQTNQETTLPDLRCPDLRAENIGAAWWEDSTDGTPLVAGNECCQYCPASLPPPAPPAAQDGCYLGDGAAYRGGAAVTGSGQVCLAWDVLGVTLAGFPNLGSEPTVHNSCRNPDPSIHSTPWCIVKVMPPPPPPAGGDSGGRRRQLDSHEDQPSTGAPTGAPTGWPGGSSSSSSSNSNRRQQQDQDAPTVPAEPNIETLIATYCQPFHYPSPACSACTNGGNPVNCNTLSPLSGLQSTAQMLCNLGCPSESLSIGGLGRRLAEGDSFTIPCPSDPSPTYLSPTCVTCGGVVCDSLTQGGAVTTDTLLANAKMMCSISCNTPRPPPSPPPPSPPPPSPSPPPPF